MFVKMKKIISTGILCISFLLTPLFAQVQNDSLFRYTFIPQPPETANPVLIDAYHNTIFNSNRQNPAASEAMLDILMKELGPVIFVKEALSDKLLDKHPESTLIIKGLPNKRIKGKCHSKVDYLVSG